MAHFPKMTFATLARISTIAKLVLLQEFSHSTQQNCHNWNVCSNTTITSLTTNTTPTTMATLIKTSLIFIGSCWFYTFMTPCPLGLGTVVKECLVTLLKNLSTLNNIGNLKNMYRYKQERNALSANCVLSCSSQSCNTSSTCNGISAKFGFGSQSYLNRETGNSPLTQFPKLPKLKKKNCIHQNGTNATLATITNITTIAKCSKLPQLSDFPYFQIGWPPLCLGSHHWCWAKHTARS